MGLSWLNLNELRVLLLLLYACRLDGLIIDIQLNGIRSISSIIMARKRNPLIFCLIECFNHHHRYIYSMSIYKSSSITEERLMVINRFFSNRSIDQINDGIEPHIFLLIEYRATTMLDLLQAMVIVLFCFISRSKWKKLLMKMAK